MKRIARLPGVIVLLAAIASPLAGASNNAVPAPSGLHAFLLTTHESSKTTFHRSPSFAWRPVRGAVRYELQISTSEAFRDNDIFVDRSTLKTPFWATTINLPWITGSPHSLYARVRAFVAGGHGSPWSSAYGFDFVPPAPPHALPTVPGLLRWSIVRGADAYEVWFPDQGLIRSFEVTRTNVLDERDFYNRSLPDIVRWRVRAIRTDAFSSVHRTLPTSSGPWSPIYTVDNTTPSTGPITLSSAISDTVSSGSPGSAVHELMPGFTWTGSQMLNGGTATYFRVYVFTDSRCLNPVFVSDAVPSPAYAPRAAGRYFPFSEYSAPIDRGESTFDYNVGFQLVVPNEQLEPAKPTLGVAMKLEARQTTPSIGPPVDLRDVAGSHRYYWTVVGTERRAANVYVDMEGPHVCGAGRVQSFSISRRPSTKGSRGPFASGLSATGGVVSAARTAKFYGEPLVAWKPALGANIYEAEWSHHARPFVRQGSRFTFLTSAVLPLPPGKWFYRVRGYDYNLPTGAQAMSWSPTAKVIVASR